MLALGLALGALAMLGFWHARREGKVKVPHVDSTVNVEDTDTRVPVGASF
jgi:hypothetical protein